MQSTCSIEKNMQKNMLIFYIDILKREASDFSLNQELNVCIDEEHFQES